MHPSSKYDNGREPEPIIQRLNRRSTVLDNGCRLWTGPTVKGGYGRMKVGSRRDGTRRNVLVHVAAWEAVHGSIPEGKTLDHFVCDTPACFNTEHLRPESIWDNTRRSETSPTAVNARKTACPNCGGPLTPKTRGTGRDCRPCRLAYFKEYNAKR